MVAPLAVPLSAVSGEPLALRADELPFAVTLARGGAEALHAQLARQVRGAVLAGTLPPGAAVPGTRTLARSLGVTRGVVEAAYAELLADGTLQAEVGRGTRVRLATPAPSTPAPVAAWTGPAWLPAPGALPVDGPARGVGTDFRLGVSGTHTLDIRAWRQAWAEAARAPVPGDYGDPAGEESLRAALAAFMGRQRGLAAQEGDLLITAGTLHALNLIVRALLPPGSAVLMENPGYRAARQVLLDAGHIPVPVPVDEDGLVVGPDTPPARLAYVTPSHQFPLGGRMCLPRRLALLEWAERCDALIVEDDFDGEFRYDAPPLPTLASLAAHTGTPGRVLYLSTLSKVLTPAVRTGFLVAPPALRPALVRARTLLDFGHPLPVQAALTWLLSGGHLDRHIRRARRWHAQVRAALTGELAGLAPYATLGGIQAGLHLCLHLAPSISAPEAARQLARQHIQVTTLDTYTFAGPPANALLLGYGGLTAAQAASGGRAVAAQIRQMVASATFDRDTA
ncbi:PLP-dependent aminotransferase family protein [Deinococcus sp. HMF7604]|uniref:MocR-like pyridoxine biosynthesis transcription factor PdxR n=1 Tax=Deinococcus betulae TaxID=2873312 RepID=UPI001CCA1220|nr:PLP-dependent aminotransferase family protein [Deinococcus betulae]MBZ9749536.1 PLP-dependent aminotransferase family protein [Deinococcus betulae]